MLFRIIVFSIIAVSVSSCGNSIGWQKDIQQARLEAQQDNNEKAATLFQHGIESGKSAGASGVQLAPIYLELSRAQLALNHDTEARAAIDAGLQSALSSGGKDNEQLIPIYKESASQFYRKQQFAQSLTAAKEALRLERACCEPGSEQLLDSLNRVISATCAQDRCADTEPYLLEQLDIRRKKLGANHPHVAVSLCLLAEVDEKKGRFKEAETKYLEALEIRKKVEPYLVSQTQKNLTRVRASLALHKNPVH